MKAEDRRNQLLDCAYNLFFSQGFDATSIQDIMKMANVSKGGLYHHFSSKEELTLAVFNRMAEQSVATMQVIVNDSSRSCVDRLQAIYDLEGEAMKGMPVESPAYTSQIFLSDANAGLHLVFNRTVAQVSNPVLAQLIRDGQELGEFAARDALSTAKFLSFINLAHNVDLAAAIDARGTDQAAQAGADLQAALTTQFDAINLLLGLPLGTIHFGWPEFVETLMADPSAN
jgi:AcrR family transcriptional regulator